MTPLAKSICKQIERKSKGLSVQLIDEHKTNIMNLMDDIHCFECTEILGVAKDLADTMERDGFFPKDLTSFMPAKKTWIEYQDEFIEGTVALSYDENGNEQMNHLPSFQYTVGFLILENENDIEVIQAGKQSGNYNIIALHRTILTKGFIPSHDTVLDVNESYDATKYGEDDYQYERLLLSLIALINSPKQIGRVHNKPQKLLQKKMKHTGMNFNAWSEIKLSVTNTWVDENGETQDVRVTGTKCLHYCRAHLRYLKNPFRISFVKGHWRGDAQNGIKQKRYKAVV